MYEVVHRVCDVRGWVGGAVGSVLRGAASPAASARGRVRWWPRCCSLQHDPTETRPQGASEIILLLTQVNYDNLIITTRV